MYRHVRLDNNEVFYVGIGKKIENFSNTFENEYKRAFSKKRSNFWHNITNKTNYIVEILFESNNDITIRRKEIEFIKLYGRKNLNNGTLCNMTDGGDGCLNRINSIERNNKISEALRKRVRRPETFAKISKSKYKRIINSLNEEFDSLTEASVKLNINISAISRALKNDKYTAAGYRWYYKSV